ncbi:MAG: FKBP-type peptidyl-prolyl cis-trans isomerase [bacterium]
MTISKDKVVSFHYRMYEEDEVLEDSRADDQQVLYLHGHRNMLAALEEALEGRQSGDQFNITLSPEKAYGHRKEAAYERVPIKYLATKSKPRPGSIVQVNTQQGPREVVVMKVGKFNVDVDTNHPLAGKTLKFEIEIGEVREASQEELSHGHAHGAGGHQH